MYRANVAVLHVLSGGKHSNRWAVNINMYPWQRTRHRDQRRPMTTTSTTIQILFKYGH